MEDSDSDDRPLNWFGKLLVALTALLTFCVAFPITWWITGQLNWDIYPRMMLLVPIVGIGFGFWVLCYVVCERLGIELQKSPERHSDPFDDPP